MVYYGYCSPSFVCANIIPIPKGSKANLSDSDKYRSIIAISSLLGKILDHIIIERPSISVTTSNYQCGFKVNSSAAQCTTMVNKTVQYNTENVVKSAYNNLCNHNLLCFDVSKAFNKVVFYRV